MMFDEALRLLALELSVIPIHSPRMPLPKSKEADWRQRPRKAAPAWATARDYTRQPEGFAG